MATKRRPRLDVQVQAEQWFNLYYALGPQRSLAHTIERGAKVGLKPRPALNTIKRWSVAYRWQERVAQLDAETNRAGTAETVRNIQRMNEDQAAIGAMGVQLAAFALERMLRKLRMAAPCDKCGVEPMDLDAQDIARVMEVFAKWQRLAMGEVTERSEIAITIWNIIIMEITQLFLAVNVYEDPEQRKREMVLGIDDIVGRQLAGLAGK